MRLVVAAILVFFLVAGAGFAARNSLPGDALYGLKRLTEDTGRMLTNDPVLRTELQQERLNEVRKLVALRRYAEVTFEGQVERIEDEAWQVSSIPLVVPAALTGVRELSVGDSVKVGAATTKQGEVIATSIRRRDEGTFLPTPPPTHTPTVSPSVTPTATSTATSTELPTATQTNMPSAAHTPTQTSTATRQPRRVSTPAPQPTGIPADNGNDNEDDDAGNSGPGGRTSNENEGKDANDSGRGGD